MGALDLDRLTWPEVEAEQRAGHDTVVVAFGATEQHGPHLPLATDALIGDHLAHLVADRLNAFVAPTVRIGCSQHHLDFPGTLSIAEETFHGLVADLVKSLARGGFRRCVLIPTHGGNFRPLATALEILGPVPGIELAALTDLGVFFALARLGMEEYGVPVGEGGTHAGEWETSLLAAIHPELVDLAKAEAGFIGEPEDAIAAIFRNGSRNVAPNGVIGDPARSNADHGQRYWTELLGMTLSAIADE